jgi:hypothetical protein
MNATSESNSKTAKDADTISPGALRALARDAYGEWAAAMASAAVTIERLTEEREAWRGSSERLDLERVAAIKAAWEVQQERDALRVELKNREAGGGKHDDRLDAARMRIRDLEARAAERSAEKSAKVPLGAVAAYILESEPDPEPSGSIEGLIAALLPGSKLSLTIERGN